LEVVSHSSRHRYRAFVQDYKRRRLDDAADPADAARPARGERRAYVREYLRWLRPYRSAAVALLLLALLTTGLQMIEPLFMRFIIDRVLLNTTFDAAQRLSHLHVAGALFAGFGGNSPFLWGAVLVATALAIGWRLPRAVAPALSARQHKPLGAGE
jgi:hypothetical protein